MLYTYRATVIRVVDGDTVDVDVSLGFDVFTHQRFRLDGIAAPESYGPKASEAGHAAKQYLSDLLPPGTPVIIQTVKDRKEKYGRYLATLFPLAAEGAAMTICVNRTLIDAGHAKPYKGGPR
jgi:micrococcal nuclease